MGALFKNQRGAKYFCSSSNNFLISTK